MHVESDGFRSLRVFTAQEPPRLPLDTEAGKNAILPLQPCGFSVAFSGLR